MTRDELFASIVAARPGRDDLVYLERCGDSYEWRIVTVTGNPFCGNRARRVDVDFRPPGPSTNQTRLRAFFDDLLAELESMADTADRCRWPIDEPWPDHAHQH